MNCAKYVSRIKGYNGCSSRARGCEEAIPSYPEFEGNLEYDFSEVRKILESLKLSCWEDNLEGLIQQALCFLPRCTCPNVGLAYAIAHLIELQKITSASQIALLEGKRLSLPVHHLEMSVYGLMLKNLKTEKSPRVWGGLIN